ncbi:MAG: zinc-binding dehydrogenase [Chitinivibrionales bacterium]|nr:zinc-binding dehydrogenase [Chitinivibrionales bacterium]
MILSVRCLKERVILFLSSLWRPVSIRLTEGEGVECVFDSIDGEMTRQAMRCLQEFGALVNVGIHGGDAFALDLKDLMRNSKRIVGWQFIDVLKHQPDMIYAALQQITDYLEMGKIRPHLSHIFPLEQAAEAQRFLIEERRFGKVVLSM